MKAPVKILRIICIVAVVILAICIATERQAAATLNQQNTAMRQWLNQMDQLVAENQRLSALVAPTTPSHLQSSPAADSPYSLDDQAQELRRLRTQVETLRQQSNQIEVLRVDTRQARASLQSALASQRANRDANRNPATAPTGSGFEIVSANYWTDKTNQDVADELRERIRGDTLRAVASNNLKGDPHFGETKRLTLVYRVGGVLMTNEFRENDVIVLPKPE